jgi:hypothetical protein
VVPPIGLALATLSGTVSGDRSYPAGFEIPAGSTLTFDPSVTTTVRVQANVVVMGTLVMRPANASVVHTLIFEGIDESGFVGGGHDPLATDPGLWVMDGGRLDLVGTPKVAWNRTGSDSTWSGSDELIVTPTAYGDYTGFKTFALGSPVPGVPNPYGGPGSNFSRRFKDTGGSVHAADIEAIANAGITKGCNLAGDLFCPNQGVTRGQMASFLARALNLPAAPSAGFTDTKGHLHEKDIDRIAASGITKGCIADGSKFCPDQVVTRGEMAVFLARALNLPAAGSAGFTDTGGHPYEADINKIFAAGITKGCTSTTYCPNAGCTRAQMASFLTRGFKYPIPTGDTEWKAEVLNLTRNVRIEGTATGRTHVFVHNTTPVIHNIKHVAIRHVGPRFFPAGALQEQKGRYGLHLHQNADNCRGTVIEGVVIRNCGNHAFVPHGSHGITFLDCISYDTWEEAYWWDDPDRSGAVVNDSHDIVWEHCVAAKVQAETGDQRKFRLNGFNLMRGQGNIIRDCAAVGVQGSLDGSGVHWQEGVLAVWTVENVVAHNNQNHGFFIWQNTPDLHLIGPFTLYHNGRYGISQGAYLNAYHYLGGTLYGNTGGGIELSALSGGESRLGLDLIFEGITIDAAGRSDYGLATADHTLEGAPVKVRNCTFLGHRVTPIGVTDAATNFPSVIDVVDCGFGPEGVTMESGTHPESVVRVQLGDQAWRITPAGTTSIAPFE